MNVNVVNDMDLLKNGLCNSPFEYEFMVTQTADNFSYFSVRNGGECIRFIPCPDKGEYSIKYNPKCWVKKDNPKYVGYLSLDELKAKGFEVKAELVPVLDMFRQLETNRHFYNVVSGNVKNDKDNSVNTDGKQAVRCGYFKGSPIGQASFSIWEGLSEVKFALDRGILMDCSWVQHEKGNWQKASCHDISKPAGLFEFVRTAPHLLARYVFLTTQMERAYKNKQP